MIQPMQPGRERLLKAYEQIPGPELAAMGVPRELQIEARGVRSRGRTRLVSEKDLRARIRRRAKECGSRITALLGIKMMRAVVGYAGDHQGSPSVSHDDVLVQEHM